VHSAQLTTVFINNSLVFLMPLIRLSETNKDNLFTHILKILYEFLDQRQSGNVHIFQVHHIQDGSAEFTIQFPEK